MYLKYTQLLALTLDYELFSFCVVKINKNIQKRINLRSRAG